MSRLRLGLLGGFGIIAADGKALTIGMRKAKALLAWLALRPGEPQSRERLAGLLWAESGEVQALHSLRQALSILRRSLPEADVLLLVDGDNIVLVSGGISSDVAELRSLAGSRDPRDLELAADLCRGELLEGFSSRSLEYEDWMLAERSRLREEVLRVLERLSCGRGGCEHIDTGRGRHRQDPTRRGRLGMRQNPRFLQSSDTLVRYWH